MLCKIINATANLAFNAYERTYQVIVFKYITAELSRAARAVEEDMQLEIKDCQLRIAQAKYIAGDWQHKKD